MWKVREDTRSFAFLYGLSIGKIEEANLLDGASFNLPDNN